MKLIAAIIVIAFLTGCTTTEHDNYVYLDAQSGISFSSSPFELTGYSITPGQPWGGVTWSASNTALIANAGRHNSSPPAAWFNTLFPNLIGDDTYANSPSDLNFAFSGNLILIVNGQNITLDDIGFGQGHNQDGNNWWMGCTNTNCIRESPGALIFNGDNVCLEFEPEGDNDRFVVQMC